MIKVTATVESDLADALRDGALGNGLAHDRGSLDAGLALALGGKKLVIRSGCAKRHALNIVYNLSVDLLVASEHNKARSFRGSVDVLADTIVYPSSSFYFTQCHNSFLLLLSGSSLARLAAKLLTYELDTLALIWFRLAE